LYRSREIFLDAQPAGGASTFSRLRQIVHTIKERTLHKPLQTFLQRFLMVTEPAGRTLIRQVPMARSSRPESAFTVLSANLWHDWPRYRRFQERLETFAQMVSMEDVDVLLLQEVARTPEIHADKWLANRLGMSYIYSRANGHHQGIGFEEGLAIFSRFPLAKPYLQQLKPDFEPFARRLVLGAELQTSHGLLPVFSVHLGMLPSQNGAQLCHLQSWVTEVAALRPALIGGDFNAHEDTSHIAQVKRTWLDLFRFMNPLAEGSTHVLHIPPWRKPSRRRLDYIFLQPGNQRWQVLDARHLDVPEAPYSDHSAVIARIEIDP
jgi:endonuclease/exonuclease/phosphatase family metal-dependent hydrolase